MVKCPTVSVVIPAYNHEDYVQAALASIIAQSYSEIEIIVINDGSTDATWQKILEYKPRCEQRFIRTEFINRENKGRCVTLQQLMQQAMGEYIYLIASDDIAKPNAIKTLVDFLEAHQDYVLAVGDNEFIDSDGNPIYWDKICRIVREEDKAVYKTFGAYLEQGCGFSFASPQFGDYASLCHHNYIPNGYLVRRSVLSKRVQFTDKAPLEDYWMMLQLAKYGKMKYINEVLFSYRWHHSNTVHQQDYMQRITLQTKQYEWDKLQNPDFEQFRAVFEKSAFRKEMKLRLGNIIQLYKEETFNGRRKVLEIMGKKIVLKEKLIYSNKQ